MHLIKDGNDCYALLPLVPGIFELQFMKGETSPEKQELARLFDAYYHNGWGKASFGHGQAFARVVPVERRIPIDYAIQPFEKVTELIINATSMALTNCYCRHEKELLDKACDAPKDVCMIFGPFADFAVDRGFGRRATRDEMLQALGRAEQAGLVHVADNVERINFICNCCGCCCGLLGTITKLNIDTAVAVSPFIAEVDPELCIACGECVNRCHVSAIKIDKTENIAKLSEKRRCIGCGLCATACPTAAVVMTPRKKWKEPFRTAKEMMQSVSEERAAFEKSNLESSSVVN